MLKQRVDSMAVMSFCGVARVTHAVINKSQLPPSEYSNFVLCIVNRQCDGQILRQSEQFASASVSAN